jgi:hypothetical protein
MNRLIAITFLALGCAVLSGCGFFQSKKDAEKVLARHFQALATNGYTAALADYGSDFFTKTPKEQWAKALKGVNTKLGAYQSHTITSWNVFKKAGTDGSGTTVSIQCDVTYSKYSATESFKLFQGVGDADFKIVSHKINSTGLLVE